MADERVTGYQRSDPGVIEMISVEDYRRLKKQETRWVNRPETVDGILFASRAEARRYLELRSAQRGGEITGLACHPRWKLVVNGVLIGVYTADFAYTDRRTGEFVVEDVKGKGPMSRDYPLRVKLMLACHGIVVREVRS